ncbi:MAG: hypothetical protein H0U22_08250 [Geodermatophilaceae bacterium]|jgi:flagellar biosynthesis/type III secretory pathway M-ring protein FliF/YscJ|nr:hypothetical protein [Geodermatophilaceae bacterium]
MSSTALIWTIVVVVIVLALVLVAVRIGASKKNESRRAEADDMRQRAAADDRTIQTHKAEAAEQEALARGARAESDRKAATADKLEMQAQEFAERASGKQTEQRERLRAADDLDPDVPEQGRHDDSSDGAVDRPGPDTVAGDHRRDGAGDPNRVDDPRDGTDTHRH